MMPHLKTSIGIFEVTKEELAVLTETCSRCGGKGWYNYWPHENKLKILYYRLIGGLRCIVCNGSGMTLTEQGRSFVHRRDFEARTDAMMVQKRSEQP